MDEGDWGVDRHAPRRTRRRRREEGTISADAPGATESAEKRTWPDFLKAVGKYSGLGSVAGGFVGAGAGLVDYYGQRTAAAKVKAGGGKFIPPNFPRLMLSRIGMCAGFFTIYQGVLSSLRLTGTNPNSDISNVLVAFGSGYVPFLVMGNGSVMAPYFAVLVMMDTYDAYSKGTGLVPLMNYSASSAPNPDDTHAEDR